MGKKTGEAAVLTVGGRLRPMGGHGHEVKCLIGTLDMGGCHGPVGTVTPRVTESLMKSLKLQLSLTARAKQVVKV
jgi:hypothetical protein